MLGQHIVKAVLYGHRAQVWKGSVRLFGTHAFLARTIDALQLLESAGYSHLVLTNLSDIRQGLRSTGYISSQGQPVYLVGVFTWNLSPAGYASLIAHHAYRQELSLTQPSPANVDIEVNCFRFQDTVLKRIAASDVEIDDAKGLVMSEARQMFADHALIEAKRTITKSHGIIRSLVPHAPEKAMFRTAFHLGVQIRGSQQFISKCEASLDLLKQLQRTEFVFENIATIKESRGRTQMHMSLTKPVVYLCWPLEQSRSPESLAGTLAHEAYHNLLYREAAKQGKEAGFNSPSAATDERSCIDFQVRVLRQLGSCEGEALALEHLTRFPTNIGTYNNFFDYIWRVLRFRG